MCFIDFLLCFAKCLGPTGFWGFGMRYRLVTMFLASFLGPYRFFGFGVFTDSLECFSCKFYRNVQGS